MLMELTIKNTIKTRTPTPILVISIVRKTDPYPTEENQYQSPSRERSADSARRAARIRNGMRKRISLMPLPRDTLPRTGSG
jgi:hypothetical protein